ncbi:hypothetical protein T08_3813 [Trichinella sp. T8]|nr:hypothetical protein T08_3813 [Trichinella sp. T8]
MGQFSPTGWVGCGSDCLAVIEIIMDQKRRKSSLLCLVNICGHFIFCRWPISTKQNAFDCGWSRDK